MMDWTIGALEGWPADNQGNQDPRFAFYFLRRSSKMKNISQYYCTFGENEYFEVQKLIFEG